MKFIVSLIVVVVAALVIATFFFPSEPPLAPAEVDRSVPPAQTTQTYLGPIQPIEAAIGLDANKVSLGAALFDDPILSEDNTIACASCHRLDAGGTNGLPMSVGIAGGIEHINVPTVFNSSLNFAQFWDGRAKTLEEQVTGPIENPLEMGSNWPGVISRLKANSDYVKQFGSLYEDGITQQTVSHAIAEFERSLVTPNSAFDQYLKGDESALTADQLAGYQLFEQLGCIRCHQGQGIGGNMFQRMGAKKDYFANRDDLTVNDMGRFNVTGDEFDRHRFKVPSLRNIALTAPYFHDSSAPTLEDAVQTMVTYQLGRRLSDEEVHLVVAFLTSLTGEYNGAKLGADTIEQNGKKL
ncbi:cytochrome-c peroxidase [Arenicella xantha]|uniref:Cytochrome c peroxidase n=1 Tax=Arenicella xantha TaxID=644221 RepID=A0A395JNQ2_9GAMM|nr:cytochrome-c peroxidase [Arenicella xantha]RBP51218.1 cytochrome c peroxidase [Arenicella xantha]